MADPANDFIRDYQTLAQQSWDAWTRQMQQQQPQPAVHPFFTPPSAPASGNDTLERTLAGLKGYFDWMQGAAANGVAAQPIDWRQQLQQLFGGANQPFAQAFGGIDSAAAEGFTRQWQSWMQTAQQQGGFGDFPGTHGPTPAFGQDREQQMKQQAMTAAMLASLQATARYQALIQRSNAQAMQRLQDKLAERAEPGRQVDSLKALYDLWVDAAEEAYAEIALTEEFREAYGEMVNTQMRLRQMQQQQTEQFCQQLGVPTRTEVSSLGERLQALRREFRASQTSGSHGSSDEVMTLRRELAVLKRQVNSSSTAAPAAKKAAPRKRSTSAVKKSVAKTPAKRPTRLSTKSAPKSPAKSPAKAPAKATHKPVASKTKAAPAAKSGTAPRKRK